MFEPGFLQTEVCASENIVWHDVTAAKMEHHHITIQIVARDALSLRNTATLAW